MVNGLGEKIEISRTLMSMFLGIYVIGGLVILCWILVSRDDHVELARTAMMLGISVVFAMALGHHTSERIAVWLRYVGEGGQVPWETWKARLWLSPILIALLDLGLATAPIYATARLGALLWRNDPRFLVWGVGGIIAGLILNWVGLHYANK